MRKLLYILVQFYKFNLNIYILVMIYIGMENKEKYTVLASTKLTVYSEAKEEGSPNE